MKVKRSEKLYIHTYIHDCACWGNQNLRSYSYKTVNVILKIKKLNNLSFKSLVE